MNDHKSFLEEPLETFNGAEAVIDEKGRVFAIGGVTFETNTPVIWLLCTRLAEEEPIKFLRGIKELHTEEMSHCSGHWNWAWLGNPQHIRWLKWLGAKFYEIQKINGEDFQRFVLERRCS